MEPSASINRSHPIQEERSHKKSKLLQVIISIGLVAVAARLISYFFGIKTVIVVSIVVIYAILRKKRSEEEYKQLERMVENVVKDQKDRLDSKS